jgi:DMSO/TMAO reductase YedYZ molybdopterin-dependent catalytic subunit
MGKTSVGIVSLALLAICLIVTCGCTGTAKSSAGAVATEDFSGWRLTLNGTTVKTLSLDDLRSMPSTTGNGFAVSTTGIKYGPYVCKGVLLTDLAELVGGFRPGDEAWISAPDGYLWVFDYDQVQGNGFVTFNESLKEIPSPPLRILLMYEQDGKLLAYNDGGPLRLAIISESPGVVTEGSAWVKWVDKIEIRRP